MVDVPNKTDLKDRLWRVYFDNIYFVYTAPMIMRILKNIPNEQVLKSGLKKKNEHPRCLTEKNDKFMTLKAKRLEVS